MKLYTCKNCGTVNKSKGAGYTDSFCDGHCYQQFRYEQKIIEWKETGILPKGTVKRYLAEKQEGCWTCGITEWNDLPIVLELEHIDGNSENNEECNLSLICPNCHSQTDTFKGRNRGNGRHIRRERYKQGQSF